MENPTINKRRLKVCNTHIDKLVYAPRAWKWAMQLYKNINL
jgi:hypothetical protein